MNNETLVIEAYQNGRPGARNWIRADCPFCPTVIGKDDGDQSFGVQEGSGFYMCFKCGTKGRLRNPPDWFPMEIDYAEHLDEQDKYFDPPDDFIHLSHGEGATHPFYYAARKHLYDRDLIDSNLWADACIGVCMRGLYRNRIVVPVRDVEGRWLGWSSRDITGKQMPKYRYPPDMQRGSMLYEQHLLHEDTGAPLLVVEGVFDALPYFGHAVATLGKPSDDHMELLADTDRRLAICMDGDAWELGESVAFRLRLAGVEAGFIRLPPKKDPGDAFKWDPDWLLEQAELCLEEQT